MSRAKVCPNCNCDLSKQIPIHHNKKFKDVRQEIDQIIERVAVLTKKRKIVLPKLSISTNLRLEVICWWQEGYDLKFLDFGLSFNKPGKWVKRLDRIIVNMVDYMLNGNDYYESIEMLEVLWVLTKTEANKFRDVVDAIADEINDICSRLAEINNEFPDLLLDIQEDIIALAKPMKIKFDPIILVK